jgi:hypothetical protein
MMQNLPDAWVVIGDFSNGKNMGQIMAGWHTPKTGLS